MVVCTCMCSMYVMGINSSFYLSFSPLSLFPSPFPIPLPPSPFLSLPLFPSLPLSLFPSPFPIPLLPSLSLSLSLTTEDYTGLYVTIALFENTGCRCINVEVVDDSVFENDEQFTVSLFTYYDISVDISPQSSSATITITDNDGNSSVILYACTHYIHTLT